MTNKRLHWFHCYPEKWLTALSDMKPDIGYVYIVICFRIYEKRGPIPDSNEAIARRTGYRPTHVARIVDTLCSLGKLVRTESGALMNPFAEREIRSQKVNTSREIESPMVNESPEKTKRNQRTADTEIELELEVEKERTEARPKRTRTRTGFPVLWVPTEAEFAYAKERGFERNAASVMFEAFGNHHRARGNLMADWSAAWRTWVNNEIKFNANRRAPVVSRPQPQWAQQRDDAEAYLKQIRERATDGDAARTNYEATPGTNILRIGSDVPARTVAASLDSRSGNIRKIDS